MYYIYMVYGSSGPYFAPLTAYTVIPKSPSHRPVVGAAQNIYSHKLLREDRLFVTAARSNIRI